MKAALQFSEEIREKITDTSTVYNFDTIDVDGKPEVALKFLKRLVGERGFEFLSRERLILAESLQASEFKRLLSLPVPERCRSRTHLDTKPERTYRQTSLLPDDHPRRSCGCSRSYSSFQASSSGHHVRAESVASS